MCQIKILKLKKIHQQNKILTEEAHQQNGDDRGKNQWTWRYIN